MLRIYLKPCAISIDIGKRIRIADSGLSADRMIVNMMNQLAIELREAKKPLVVESNPMTASANEPSPINGARNRLSIAVFQLKNGRKATLRFSIQVLGEKSGTNRSSAMMFGLMNAAMTRAANPMMIIKIVIISGTIGRVLMVKRRCGCNNANRTIKNAR